MALPARNPFAGLARTASRGLGAVRAAAPRAMASTRAAASTSLTKVRKVYDANKEPASAAMTRYGTEYTGHGLGYLLDRVYQWRAWGGWLRPSFFLGIASFVGAAFTGGKWSRALLNIGDGLGHHYGAGALIRLDQALTGDAPPTATAGTEPAKPPF